MTPVELTSLLKDYGPWGLLALALMGAKWALNGWHKCMENHLVLIDKLSAVLERNAINSAAVAAALESRTGQFEKLSLQTEGALKEILSKIEDVPRDVADQVSRRP